jgi:hypothetical protein
VAKFLDVVLLDHTMSKIAVAVVGIVGTGMIWLMFWVFMQTAQP